VLGSLNDCLRALSRLRKISGEYGFYRITTEASRKDPLFESPPSLGEISARAVARNWRRVFSSPDDPKKLPSSLWELILPHCPLVVEERESGAQISLIEALRAVRSSMDLTKLVIPGGVLLMELKDTGGLASKVPEELVSLSKELWEGAFVVLSLVCDWKGYSMDRLVIAKHGKVIVDEHPKDETDDKIVDRYLPVELRKYRMLFRDYSQFFHYHELRGHANSPKEFAWTTLKMEKVEIGVLFPEEELQELLWKQ